MNNDHSALDSWLKKTYEFSSEYLKKDHEKNTPVVNYLEPMKLKDAVNVSLGKSHTEEECWSLIEKIIHQSVRTTHPLFLNQLFGGVHPEALAGEWLASLLNPTMATFEIAPMMTIIEKELIRKLCNKIGFKLGEGIMVTGGSNANLVGLLCARQFKVPDVKKRGYQGKKYTVYVSANAHYSYEKAVHISGLGVDHLRLVKVDASGAMDPIALREVIREDIALGYDPLMIGATAGTTVMGAFDPITEINKVARDLNLWLHVDAAWGGGAIFSEKHKHLLKGIHLADSITIDAHKTLNTGLISSFVLCKHPGMLKQTNQGGGSEYIFHDYDNSDWDTGTYSLQCGRRPDALKVWLLWMSKGDKGMEQIIDHLFDSAEYVKKQVEENPRLKILSASYLNVCFQVQPLKEIVDINQFTLKVRTHMVRKGHALVNYVQKPDGTIFFRFVAANNVTTTKDLDQLFAEISYSIEAMDKIC